MKAIFIKSFYYLLLFHSFLISGNISATESAENEYKNGVANYDQQKYLKAIDFFERSLELQKTFQGFYYLGMSCLREYQTNNPSNELLNQAKRGFKQAQLITSEPNYAAKAIGRLAEIDKILSNHMQALATIRQAISIHDTPRPDWMDDLQLELIVLESKRTSQIDNWDSKSIVTELQGSLGSNEQRFGPVDLSGNSLSMKINFNFAQTSVTSGTQKNLQALAIALASESFRDMRFKLIGHADAIGKTLDNQLLSEKRARYIRDWLINQSPDLTYRLDIEGKGETQLLYPNAITSKEHESNRRLEIIIL